MLGSPGSVRIQPEPDPVPDLAPNGLDGLLVTGQPYLELDPGEALAGQLTGPPGDFTRLAAPDGRVAADLRGSRSVTEQLVEGDPQALGLEVGQGRGDRTPGRRGRLRRIERPPTGIG